MTKVVISCGALAIHVKQIAARRGWDLDVRPIPPELHNRPERIRAAVEQAANGDEVVVAYAHCGADLRSEEHTSELQSRFDLVCRLLLEKKNNHNLIQTIHTL